MVHFCSLDLELFLGALDFVLLLHLLDLLAYAQDFQLIGRLLPLSEGDQRSLGLALLDLSLGETDAIPGQKQPLLGVDRWSR